LLLFRESETAAHLYVISNKGCTVIPVRKRNPRIYPNISQV